MTLFTVDADGSPLGIAATATPEAAADLVRRLCRAQELAMAHESTPHRVCMLSVRPSTLLEEAMFQRSAVSGGLRLAGILIGAD